MSLPSWSYGTNAHSSSPPQSTVAVGVHAVVITVLTLGPARNASGPSCVPAYMTLMTGFRPRRVSLL